MKKTNLTMLLSVGTMLCATLQSATAIPMTQRAPVGKSPIFEGRTLPQAGTLIIGNPIPLMTQMVDYARIGNVSRDAKAAVYATVVITSPTFYSKPGRSSVAYANSVLTLTGAKGSEYFTGDLKMTRNNGDVNAPFQGIRFANSSTRITIRRDGFVSIRTTVAGRLKSSVETTSFKSDGADGFLWGRDANDGKPQLISVMFAKSVFLLANAQPVSTPAPAEQPIGPRGMKVRVGGEIRITNSDDGVADGQVEMFGNISFNGQEMWSIKRSSAQDGDKGDVILLDYITCNVLFDDSSTWILKVTGNLADRDMGKGDTKINADDDMWNPFTGKYNAKTNNDYKTFDIDLKKMIEQGSRQTTLYGDRDSENANLKIKVQKLADIN